MSASAEVKYPLVPEAEKPEACRRLGCRFTLYRDGVLVEANGEIVFNLAQQDLVAFAHHDGDRLDAYPIPIAWLDDVDRDIWGEIKPWLESLHRTDEPR